MSAIMNTVYNNYLTTYASRQITKYDTHKKSELRSVYTVSYTHLTLPTKLEV